MPNKDEHKDWAFHNEDFANELTCDDFENYQDWRIIVLFYTALHYVEAYFAKKHGEHFKNHQKRKDNILCSPDLNPYFKKYRHLEDDSVDARYKCREFTKQEVDQIKRDKFQPLVSFIKNNYL